MDSHATNIYNAVLITSFVLGIIISYFAISLVRHQRKNLELSKKNILAEITGLEKDRARIASDLHDELGPMLSSVKMRINSFELTDTEDQLQIKKTNQHIDDILQRMREISFDLMPSSLLRKGLIVALNELIDDLNRNSQIAFKFIYEKKYDIAEEKAINMYRIIRELIHNAIKHSGASKVEIDLKENDKLLMVRISDNGVGFNYDKSLKEGIGFGLRSIESRTKIMGGQMFVQSIIDQGTSYNIQIPFAYDPIHTHTGHHSR